MMAFALFFVIFAYLKLPRSDALHFFSQKEGRNFWLISSNHFLNFGLKWNGLQQVAWSEMTLEREADWLTFVNFGSIPYNLLKLLNRESVTLHKLGIPFKVCAVKHHPGIRRRWSQLLKLCLNSHSWFLGDVFHNEKRWQNSKFKLVDLL